MCTYTISAPVKLRATVRLPASKSISNRALIIHALSGGDVLPSNLSDCDDTEVMVSAMEKLRQWNDGQRQHTAACTIDIKAAGTAMRFMTAYLAATAVPEVLITGTERMKHRPIRVLVDALRHLGADICYAGEEGFPPLRINGRRLDGGRLEVAGNVSSQYISALLLIGPLLRRGLQLRMAGSIISRPYIDLTLWMMREYGAQAEWTAVDTITVKPQPYTPRPYLTENDWSAASYWYEMVALSNDPDAQVRLEGLMDGSKQGDSSVRFIFSLLGVKTTFDDRTPGKPTTVTLTKSSNRVGRLEYDFTNAPDLAQTIVCTCCAMGLPFHFTGLQTLKIKETDRIEALKTEMRKLGIALEDRNDSELLWTGPSKHNAQPSIPTTQPAIDTYEDHRMAMAFAPMSMVMPMAIRNPQVVTKSYPHFWSDLRTAGFTVLQH